MDVAYPSRRQEILDALDVLAAQPPELADAEHDRRWPGVTEAVHWLVDDTAWDLDGPARSIGYILRDEKEAELISVVVQAIVRISDRQGPTAPDAAWFGDPDWINVRAAAGAAAAWLRTGGQS